MKIKLLDCAVRLSEFAASIALAASYLARSINDDLHVATHNAVVDKHDKLVDRISKTRASLKRAYLEADDRLSDAEFERRKAIAVSASEHLA